MLDTVTCYHLPGRMGGATKIGSERAFQIKLPDGLNISRVHTTFTVPRAAYPTSHRLEMIFMHMGAPKAHVNSRKCQTATASPAEPGELPVGLERLPTHIANGTSLRCLLAARPRKSLSLLTGRVTLLDRDRESKAPASRRVAFFHLWDFRSKNHTNSISKAGHDRWDC